MQDSKRNILNSLKKNLKIANRRYFLHRLIYILQFQNVKRDFKLRKKIYETKIMNQDRVEESLNGMIFYIQEYAICLLEGSEDHLNKHVQKLVINNFQGKVLIFIPHILKRYFMSWYSIRLEPSILLDTIDGSMNATQHGVKVRDFVMKVLKLSEFLTKSMSEHTHEYEVVRNMPDTWRRLIPEEALLQFLVESPLLLPIQHYYQNISTPLLYQPYHEITWPLPATFLLPTSSKKSLLKEIEMGDKEETMREDNLQKKLDNNEPQP